MCPRRRPVSWSFVARENRQALEELRRLLPDLADVSLDAVVAAEEAAVIDQVLVNALGGKAQLKAGLYGVDMGYKQAIAGRRKRWRVGGVREVLCW